MSEALFAELDRLEEESGPKPWEVVRVESSTGVSRGRAAVRLAALGKEVPRLARALEDSGCWRGTGGVVGDDCDPSVPNRPVCGRSAALAALEAAVAGKEG